MKKLEEKEKDDEEWDMKKHLRKEDPSPPPSTSACADPAATQNQASVLLVSRAKLMLGIENHKVDL